MSESTYRVRVGYVDHSYWDDGSRYTSQTFKFTKRKDAIKFAREALHNGCDVNGQNHSIKIRPCKGDITIYRDTVSEVDWQDE